MRVAFFAAAIALLTSLLPSTAFAGECEGMLSYTYEAGECYDRTGSTTDLLIRSGNESESLQQGMISRSRSFAFGGGSAGRRAGGGVPEGPYMALGHALMVRYRGPYIVPSLAAKHFASSNPKLRAQLVRLFTGSLNFYAARGGDDYLDSHWLPGARVFFVEAAYLLLGEQMPEDGTRTLLDQAFTGRMIHSQIPLESEAAKEAMRETYVMQGMTITIVGNYLIEHHRKAELAKLKQSARIALERDLGVDPMTLPVTDIYCRMNNFSGMFGSCARERQILTGHG